MNINLKIKQIRIEKEISLRKLAHNSKVSKGYLSDLEDPICTKKNPSLATLCKIALALEVKPCELYQCEDLLFYCPHKSL